MNPGVLPGMGWWPVRAPLPPMKWNQRAARLDQMSQWCSGTFGDEGDRWSRHGDTYRFRSQEDRTIFLLTWNDHR